MSNEKDGVSVTFTPDMPQKMNNGVWPQAFPRLPSTGMTLRDWFAGQVIAGNWDDREDVLLIAKSAYVMADAMLAAR